MWNPLVDHEKFIEDEELDDSSFECDSINDEDVCIKLITSLPQEKTMRNRGLFIDKNLQAIKALQILENFLNCYSFKQKVRFLIYRNERLHNIYQNIQARKIANLFKNFSYKKKEAADKVLNLYKEYCATFIQKIIRGFITRKYKQKLKLSKNKILGLVLG